MFKQTAPGEEHGQHQAEEDNKENNASMNPSSGFAAGSQFQELKHQVRLPELMRQTTKLTPHLEKHEEREQSKNK